MKKIFLLLCCISIGLNAWEIPLETGVLRGSKGTWKYPELTAIRPGRSADLYFSFKQPEKLSRFNRIKVELTPLEGKFIKRNLLLCFFDKKEIARVRPEKTVAGEALENGKKVTLEYGISSNLKNVTAVRLFFNRKNDDRSDQKFLLHKIEFFQQF